MTREIRNTPHPTPSPDGPHAASSGRKASSGIRRPANFEEEPASDEPSYDSCMDDLNLILSKPVTEPDPALKAPSSDALLEGAPGGGLLPSFLQERGKEPRTSEVFPSVGPSRVDVTEGATGSLEAPLLSLTDASPDPETEYAGTGLPSVAPSPKGHHQPRAVDLAADDEPAPEGRLPWTLLMFMSYSSAVTLALTWVLVTGRSFRSAEPAYPQVSQAEPESVSKVADSVPDERLPPLPVENVTALGQSVRLGDLEITPLNVTLRPVELVRSIEPSKVRHEKSLVLVLRVRFKNVSMDHALSPLERRFLREQTSAIDRSSIVSSEGKSINLFPLAVDSEWSIVGQEFPSLAPGESRETMIASAPDPERLLGDEMTWRLRLRVGPFRTDVLGVRFQRTAIKL
jgi:hypothetical protein